MAMDMLRPRYFRACFLLLLWVIWLQTSPCGFGRTSQRPLSELREGTGLEIRKSARGTGNFDLSSAEKILVSSIARASDDRDWTTARSLFGEYTGSAPPVYGATLQAALRCREYKEGAKIYEICQANCNQIGEPALSAALRIFAKLGERSRVRQVWDDAKKRLNLSEILASARIVAATEEGDVDTAAEILDNMTKNNVSIKVHHINAAMRTCWGWGQKQHKAAKYFFDLLHTFELSPTVISFTSLIGAYFTATLQEVLSAYGEMKALKIRPDTAFVETYLFSLLQTRKGRRVEEQMHEISVERLQAARDALAEFQAAGVPLSLVCTKVYKELTRMGF